jgi:hypothetical protein
MKSPHLALPIALVLVGCSQGLSEDEKRAAKAHADNICLMAEMDKTPPGSPGAAQILAGIGDIAKVMDREGGPETHVVSEGNRLARERGCVK